MAKKDEGRNKAIDDVLAQINKKMKSDVGNVVNLFGDKPIERELISTGSLVLDSILGGGFPKGRLIEIYGPEASGKTSITLTAIGNVQKKGGVAAFIDLEHALDPNYATTLGVDMNNLIFSQPDYGEQALDLIMLLTESAIVDMIVVDSVAALIPKAELEGTMEDHTMGAVARMLSKSLKQLVSTASKNGVTIVFINQVREKIGGFSPVGTPETTTGGRAMKFFASQRIRISRAGEIKENGKSIGNEVRMKIQKNKIAPPFLQGTTVLTFAKGINRAAELIQVAPDYGVILRPNSRKYVEAETGEIIGNSKAEALEAIENDTELYDRIAAAFAIAVDASIKAGPDAEKKTLLDSPNADEESTDDED